MTFEPARPRYTLPVGGKDFDLLGTFEVIEAAENALQKPIQRLTAEILDSSFTDTSKLLAAVLTACGHKTSRSEAAGMLFELGLDSEAYVMVKLHLSAFFQIALSPPEAREQKANEVGEMIRKWKALSASLGENIRSSATESSAGSQKPSGKRRSGK